MQKPSHIVMCILGVACYTRPFTMRSQAYGPVAQAIHRVGLGDSIGETICFNGG